jgi:hypothetical protein
MARFEIILGRRDANDEGRPGGLNAPRRLKSVLLTLLVTAVAIGVLVAAALVGAMIFVLFLVLLVMAMAIGVAKAMLRPGQRAAR